MRGVKPAEINLRRRVWIGRVGEHDRLALHHLEPAAQRRAFERREPLRVAADLLHFGVAHDGPEVDARRRTLEHDARMVKHRAALAEIAEQVVREAVAVERAIGEIDVENDHAANAIT